MAIPQLHLQSLSTLYFPRRQTASIFSPKSLSFTVKTDTQLEYHITAHGTELRCFKVPNFVPNKDNQVGSVWFTDISGRWIDFVRGGKWWDLGDSEEPEFSSAKPITALHAIRRIWEFVADDKWVLYVAFGSLVIAAVSEVSMPSILAASIFNAQSGETVAFARNLQILALLCFTSGICSGLRSGCFAIANIILVKGLREKLYSALVFQDISFFDNETVGDLTSRLGADCQQLAHVIGNNINLILRNVLQGTGALINLLALSWPLALSALLVCSVQAAVFLVYGQYQKKAAKLTQKCNASANEATQETLSLMRLVRVYGTEREEIARYKQWLDRLAFINIRESVANGFWNMSFNVFCRSTQVFAVVLGGMSILTGHASAEQLMKYVLYCEWLIYATWRVADNLTSLLQSLGASEKVFQLMDLLPTDQFSSKGLELQSLTGHIQFVDVSFHYPSRAPILKHINLNIQANEVVAIVGLSGSGKSTLVNLLLRLYKPAGGQIYVDGFPLGELNIRWLRSNIGFVGQEPQLFRMDVKSNIKYGCSIDVTEEDIQRAAEQAHVHEFILSLPNGYETLVDNELISGGQKQRIAIARAILRKPAILILDEATSALDLESEHYVKRILHTFKNDAGKKRTVIIIAHRLSTIRAADKIIVMDGGQVTEVGEHAELLQNNGLYARLVNMQMDVVA